MTQAPDHPSRRRRAMALLVAALPVAGWVFWEAHRTFHADVASAAARARVSTWASGVESPRTAQEWDDAHAALQTALGLTPDDPDLHERLGDLHGVAGRRDWALKDLRRQHFGRAAEAYRQALALRPGEPATWAMLASTYQVLGTDRARVQEAWAKARALGPLEAHLQPILLQIVLADWAGAAPEMQDWAKRLFDQGDAATRAYINTAAQPYGLIFNPDIVSAP
jgi:tetratricopeptide (TPR) repeat protein